MVHVLLNHKVRDYDHWKPYFDKDAVNRLKAGIRVAKLFRSMEDPNDISILFTVDNIESFNNFLKSPDLKKIMEEGGVISMPEVKMLQELSLF